MAKGWSRGGVEGVIRSAQQPHTWASAVHCPLTPSMRLLSAAPLQRPSLPLVCKRWRALCEGTGPLWQELFLNFRHIYNSSYL